MSKMNDPKAEQRLQLTMIAYGSSKDDPVDDFVRFTGNDQRRVEVQATPLVPASLVGNVAQLTAWAQNVARGLVIDIKHSQQWHCEFCGESFVPSSLLLVANHILLPADKLARETSVNFASWVHLTPPRLNVYVSSVLYCEDLALH